MNFKSELEKYLKKAFFVSSSGQKNLEAPRELLKKAMLYSFKSKASHFRPKLCFETTKALGQKTPSILPWAIALEMIHTGSLIHDDMPCMDDAQIRRGKKSHHLVFGEDLALLSGTCLFVESFALLQAPVFDKNRLSFLKLLLQTTGFQGLMSGQVMDLKIQSPNKKQLSQTRVLKTGALISACVLGPSLLWANKKEHKALEVFAKHLGLAYQIADDFKDIQEDSKSSCKKALQKEGFFHLKKSLKSLSGFKSPGLRSLVKEIQQAFL